MKRKTSRRERPARRREIVVHSSELRIAQLIEHTLITREPAAPAGWSIGVHYEAAKVVGGDFYDVVPLANGWWALLTGDVSGKGMPAALVMASTLRILRNVLATGAAPHLVLEHANAELAVRLPRHVFVTCQYAVLNPTTGLLRYANAGHCPALRVYGGASVQELAGGGLPLGVEPKTSYPETELTLGQGDSLLLYSDGVVEARSPDGTLFGFDRLQQFVSGSASAVPGLIQRLLEALDRHRATRALDDDLMLVLVQRDSTVL